MGIHNGCITNHEALNIKYERKFEVDSMHIFAHIAEKKAKPGNKTWYKGIRGNMDKKEGNAD